jgi:hypothetical protein
MVSAELRETGSGWLPSRLQRSASLSEERGTTASKLGSTLGAWRRQVEEKSPQTLVPFDASPPNTL